MSDLSEAEHWQEAGQMKAKVLTYVVLQSLQKIGAMIDECDRESHLTSGETDREKAMMSGRHAPSRSVRQRTYEFLRTALKSFM